MAYSGLSSMMPVPDSIDPYMGQGGQYEDLLDGTRRLIFRTGMETPGEPPEAPPEEPPTEEPPAEEPPTDEPPEEPPAEEPESGWMEAPTLVITPLEGSR